MCRKKELAPNIEPSELSLVLVPKIMQQILLLSQLYPCKGQYTRAQLITLGRCRELYMVQTLKLRSFTRNLSEPEQRRSPGQAQKKRDQRQSTG